uniref:Gonadotropin-releasing hormone II receptor n=1 Tax=Ascaris suum TaxID=6253 RepID=F1L8Z3_ASCSU
MPSTSPSNCTLPNVDKFSWQAVILIVSHVILFCFAAIGNIFMLLILHRNLRSNKGNRTFLLLLHMNVADLIVTFEYLPKQVIHMYTVWWYGGDLLCKMGRFFDIFGVSLSSAVLICMCFDRMLSVSRPFSTFYGIQRNKVMLGIAWITAFAISLPQLGIFLTASHPCDRSYVQCVARDYIGLLDTRYVLAYTFATAIYIYFLPLAVIIGCYTLIFYRLKISVRSQKNAVVTSEGNCVVTTSDSFHKANSRLALPFLRLPVVRIGVSFAQITARRWSNRYETASSLERLLSRYNSLFIPDASAKLLPDQIPAKFFPFGSFCKQTSSFARCL